VTASLSPTRLDPVTAVAIVATDNAFAPAEFAVRAGQPFTVTLENRGQAIHDWRVRGQTGADGRDAGTRLLSPGQSQAITLTIDRPGDFAVYCEVHPVDMRGKLTVVSGP
jgi:plastocyanin